jgi:copper chaperone CopZ
MTVVASARLVRASRGRIRVHLPEWDGRNAHELERVLGGRAGVMSVQASAATGNILIVFDEARADQEALIAATEGAAAQLDRLHRGAPRAAAESSAAAEASAAAKARAVPGPTTARGPGHPLAGTSWVTGVIRERAGRFGRARITVRGIDRDPQLARRVVAALERRPDVRRAVANATTGRVLVEFSDRVASLQDVLAEVSRLELPDVEGEDRPAHPLDPAPVLQSGARVIGSALGLALIAGRNLLGAPSAPVPAHAPAAAAGAIGILEGAPPFATACATRSAATARSSCSAVHRSSR